MTAATLQEPEGGGNTGRRAAGVPGDAGPAASGRPARPAGEDSPGSSRGREGGDREQNESSETIPQLRRHLCFPFFFLSLRF